MMLSTMVVLLMMSLLESSGAPPRLIRKESMSVVFGDIADEGATLIQRITVSVSDKIKSAFFQYRLRLAWTLGLVRIQPYKFGHILGERGLRRI